MNVVWVWDNHINHAMSWNGGHPLRIALTLASVRSWMHYYPEDRRVIFLDRETKRFLESLKALDWWDDIREMDFKQEAIDRGLDNTPCWGAVKDLSATLVGDLTGPVLFVDTDTVIHGKFKESLNPNIPWGYARYSLIGLEENQKDSLVGTRVELDERVSNGPFKFNVFEGLNMSFSYFPTAAGAVECGQLSLDYIDYLRVSGCFEGHNYFSEGILPWQYVLLADEVIFNNWVLNTYGIREILYEKGCPVKHVEQKWFYSSEDLWLETREYLGFAGLPVDLLDQIKNPQGILT